MAALALVASHRVNGVAALHSTLPVSQVALEFHERKFPDPREGVRYRTKIVEAFRNNGFELVVNGKEEVLFVKTRSP